MAQCAPQATPCHHNTGTAAHGSPSRAGERHEQTHGGLTGVLRGADHKALGVVVGRGHHHAVGHAAHGLGQQGRVAAAGGRGVWCCRWAGRGAGPLRRCVHAGQAASRPTAPRVGAQQPSRPAPPSTAAPPQPPSSAPEDLVGGRGAAAVDQLLAAGGGDVGGHVVHAVPQAQQLLRRNVMKQWNNKASGPGAVGGSQLRSLPPCTQPASSAPLRPSLPTNPPSPPALPARAPQRRRARSRGQRAR